MIESGGWHAVKKGGKLRSMKKERERERERESRERPDGLKAVHVAARVDRERSWSMRCGGQQNQNA